MYLIINTSDNKKIFIGLIRDDKLISKKIISAKYKQAEKLLPMIEKLLEKNKVCLKNLKGIIIAKGPGSFTSLRVGVVTANTLSFALGIPVVGVGVGEFDDLEGLVKKGVEKLKKGRKGKIVKPVYG